MTWPWSCSLLTFRTWTLRWLQRTGQLLVLLPHFQQMSLILFQTLSWFQWQTIMTEEDNVFQPRHILLWVRGYKLIHERWFLHNYIPFGFESISDPDSFRRQISFVENQIRRAKMYVVVMTVTTYPRRYHNINNLFIRAALQSWIWVRGDSRKRNKDWKR